METIEGADEAVRSRVRAYYRETTEESYLVWGGSALALHLGLAARADEPAPDRDALSASLLAMNAHLADRAAITAGTRVLDAGCGVGGSSIWLSRERGAHVLGLTLDPGQVTLARRFAGERGATTCAFAVADYADSGLAPGTFDVVWMLESLCHAADPRRALAHARSLLAPGGRFVCADFFAGGGGPDCAAMCRGWVLPSLRTAGEIAALLAEVGFTEVVSSDLTPRVLPSAEVMKRVAFEEVMRLEVSAAAAGTERRERYADHFYASIAAAAGLRSGEITYASLTAR